VIIIVCAIVILVASARKWTAVLGNGREPLPSEG
jgi:hypothetical protein